MSKQTHDEVMQEIETVKKVAAEAIESDCLGDMMTWMDAHNINYACRLIGTDNPDQTIQERDRDTENDNDTIRQQFKHAVLREMAGLWGVARTTYEKEMFAM